MFKFLYMIGTTRRKLLIPYL